MSESFPELGLGLEDVLRPVPDGYAVRQVGTMIPAFEWGHETAAGVKWSGVRSPRYSRAVRLAAEDAYARARAATARYIVFGVWADGNPIELERHAMLAHARERADALDAAKERTPPVYGVWDSDDLERGDVRHLDA